MAQTRLSDFMEVRRELKKRPPPEPKFPTREELASFSPEEPEELGRAYLIDVSYDGKRGCARLKLYEPGEQKVYVWYDKTGHKPYCLTDISPGELARLPAVVKHTGYDHAETVEKLDLLRDRRIRLTKVVAKDPLSIGGRPKGCIRDLIKEEAKRILGYEAGVWEAAIKYHECYIYDNGLLPGMPYRISGGRLLPAWEKPKAIDELQAALSGQPEELRKKALEWATLLECEAPELRRVALDIEVFTEMPTRVPNAHEAPQPIICVSLVGSDGLERVLLLRRPGVEEGDFNLPEHVRVEFYEDERELLLAIFGALIDYPVVITFNGDDFDLRYIFHRAERLGFTRDEIPIEPGRDKYSLRYGIHIDLYKLFSITALQVYAFGKKYESVSLDELGASLLGVRKVELSKPLSELSYAELASYCYRDALITLKLTQFDDDLVMKLAILLSRISKMPIEDATRLSVSRWIRSFMQFELRRMGALIPNPADILAEKGKTATKAMVKGRYMGAIVVKPKPGIHMDVVVLDFASLYPSAIKTWNLSFETVRCPHPECRDNLVPGLPHWVCKKRRGVSSLLIGSLRDLRVYWYKPRSKDKRLPKHVRDWYKVVQLTLKVILNASADYEEPVVLMAPDGDVVIMSIGEFFKLCAGQYGFFQTYLGRVSRPTGWKALSVDTSTGKLSFGDISYVIEHDYEGLLLEIELRSGRKFKVSPDHSVLTLDPSTGSIVPVEADELKPGDMVLVPTYVPNGRERPIARLNLVREFLRLPLRHVDDIMVIIPDGLHARRRKTLIKVLEALSDGRPRNTTEIAHEASIDPRTASEALRTLKEKGLVVQLTDKNNLKTYKISSRGARTLELQKALSSKLRRRRGRRGYYYIMLNELRPFTSLIDDELVRDWRLCLHGRGRARHKIRALVELSAEFARLLGYYVAEGHCRAYENRTGHMTYSIVIYNEDEELLEDVARCVKASLGIEPRRGTRYIAVNSKIAYVLFNEVLRMGRRAEEKRIPHILFNASKEFKMEFLRAYCRGDGNFGRSEVKLTTKSEELANQLIILLAQLGIKGISTSREGTVYRIWVRDDRLARRPARRRTYAYVIPNALVREMAERLRMFSYVYKDGKNLGLERARTLLKEYRARFGDDPKARALSILLNGDVALDSVKRTKWVRPTNGAVYDISVNGHENFVGGFGMVCLHNSYGVFGADIFEFYCPPVAESTAAIGRHAITSVIKRCEEMGMEVLYGDTDSVFLANPGEERIQALIDWAEEALGMDLDVDKVYRYVVFSERKKNYLGVLVDGSVDVKGLTGKKKHVPRLIKEAFERVVHELALVESPEDLEAVKERVKAIVREYYNRLKKRQFEPEDLAFHVTLGKEPEKYTKTTPQHVKAARELKRKLGRELKAGDIISFVKVTPRKSDGDVIDVLPVELATKEDVDVDKYISFLESTFEQILDALGMSFSEVVGLTRLESFMS